MLARYRPARSSDFEGILALQRGNLRARLTDARQGYLTIAHEFAHLRTLNAPVPHTVATEATSGRLLGYALSMSPRHRRVVPGLEAMFDALDGARWRGRLLGEQSYTVMGQVCVAAEARGQGVFRGMYEAWFAAQAERYDVACTEIDARNERSLGAHRAVGFEEIGRYAQGTQTWVLVARTLT